MSRTRLVRVGAGALLVLGGASGCTSNEVDDVLWRQTIVYKDAVWNALRELETVPSDDLADAITLDSDDFPGDYWDGAADPAELHLEAGGMALYNVKVSGDRLNFDVLISSGPRDVDADPYEKGGGLYFGPGSVYTCYSMNGPDAFDEWTLDAVDECPNQLVRTLDGAQFVDVREFYG